MPQPSPCSIESARRLRGASCRSSRGDTVNTHRFVPLPISSNAVSSGVVPLDTSTTAPFVHDHWEEVYLLQGDLIVGNAAQGKGGEPFDAPTYACRPPGASHEFGIALKISGDGLT